MPGNKAAIKARIKSINATKKITGAMKLVSTVKLQRNRNNMDKNKHYADTLKQTVSQMLSGNTQIESEYLNEKDAPLKLYFVFCADMGLCGGYNINLLKFIREQVDKKDYLIVMGTKIYNTLWNEGYHILNEVVNIEEVNHLYLKDYCDKAIRDFKANIINSINVIYTEFKNSVSFEPKIEKVLPCKLESQETKYKEILFEPSPNEILEQLIPMMVNNNVYSRLLEAKTAEQGSRRLAMENATDNANELTDKLLLAYNQARQAAITQEITEIVSGSDAL